LYKLSRVQFADGLKAYDLCRYNSINHLLTPLEMEFLTGLIEERKGLCLAGESAKRERSVRIKEKRCVSSCAIRKRDCSRKMPLGKRWRLCALTGGLILGLIAVPLFAASEKEVSAQSLSHYMMGLIYDGQDNPQKAIEEYTKTQKLDSDNYLVHLRLGIDYARTGRSKEAIAEFKNASSLNPQDLHSRYFLALLYISMRDNAAANQEFEFILKDFSKEEPGNVKVHSYLGKLYLQDKRFTEAMEQFRAALALDGKNIEVRIFLGAILEQQGNLDEAIRYLSEALRLDPKNSEVLNSLGYIYARQGKNLDKAERLIKEALVLEPDNGAYIDSLGWVYFKKAVQTNDKILLARAIKELEKANSLLSDPEILLHLGEAYFENGELDKAKEFWQKSMELDPGQKELKLRLEKIPSKNE